jgi:Transposase DDE domain group 1
VHLTAHSHKIMVSADGTGIVSQAGGLLLLGALRATGLDRGLEVALERWRPARALHSPGKIVTDLAVALALGGDCLADVAMLRAEPELFGPVASDPVVSRLMARLAPGSRWRSCCGQATLARTPPLITSRPPGWPWRSCPATCGGGC